MKKALIVQSSVQYPSRERRPSAGSFLMFRLYANFSQELRGGTGRYAAVVRDVYCALSRNELPAAAGIWVVTRKTFRPL